MCQRKYKSNIRVLKLSRGFFEYNTAAIDSIILNNQGPKLTSNYLNTIQ